MKVEWCYVVLCHACKWSFSQVKGWVNIFDILAFVLFTIFMLLSFYWFKLKMKSMRGFPVKYLPLHLSPIHISWVLLKFFPKNSGISIENFPFFQIANAGDSDNIWCFLACVNTTLVAVTHGEIIFLGFSCPKTQQRREKKIIIDIS
jgi:hypothetical protein